MIVNKEQLDAYDNNGNLVKDLIISYVNKEGNISFLKWQIPVEEMFEWKYTKRSSADMQFAVYDKNGQPVIDEQTGRQKIAQWKSYDNKWIKREPTTKNLSESRLNEIINKWSAEMGMNTDILFEANTPNTWFCDIETDVSDDGFPDAESAICPINTIAITQFPQTIVFSRKNLSEKEIQEIQIKLDNYSEYTKGYKFEFKYFSTEREMIEAFIDFINPIPNINGWNFLGYDWLYIFNRCNNLGINIQRICPTNSYTRFKLARKNVIDVKVPTHKIISDYMIIYKQWDRTVEVKENDTLDFVSHAVLGINKVEHEWGFKEFYTEHFMEYVFYNAVDTILVEQIDKKIKTAQIWYMLAAELRIDLNQAFSTIQPAETVMTNFVYPKYKVVPRKFDINESNGDYEGAFVWPTQPGIYKMIGGLDFASLYPSTMRQFNISPESFMFKDKNYVPKEDEIKTVSGAVYKKIDAVIPAILTEYYAKRKQAKKDRLVANTAYEDLLKIYERRLAAGES